MQHHLLTLAFVTQSQSCDDDDNANDHDDGDNDGGKWPNHVQVIKAPVLKLLTEVLCTIAIFYVDHRWKQEMCTRWTSPGHRLRQPGEVCWCDRDRALRRSSSETFKLKIIIIIRIGIVAIIIIIIILNHQHHHHMDCRRRTCQRNILEPLRSKKCKAVGDLGEWHSACR